MALNRDESVDAPELGHPIRRFAGGTDWPEIGERLPDFQLPDATGQVIDSSDRGSAKAAVVFYPAVGDPAGRSSGLRDA